MPESIVREKTKIIDVFQTKLCMHHDSRGIFTEIFRESWFVEKKPIQWNVVHSIAGTFRGFHVHLHHHDYLTVAHGEAHFFLKDLRQDSLTFMVEDQIIINANEMKGLYIPTGVAHAFYFPVPCTHIYSVTEYWDLDDELGFHYQDSDLGFDLGNLTLNVSTRDQNLGTMREILEKFK